MHGLPPEAGPSAHELARSLDLTRTAAQVLCARGHQAAETVERFFNPRLAELTDPSAMLGRADAADRLARAIREGERICVFGDYDADGITSTAILTEMLRALGGDVTNLLANRFGGGYGLSDPAVERVLETGATVLVTCDCGSSDHERLVKVRAKGIDAIVVDHHRVPPEPLPVRAFLNPHQPGCGFAYKGLASCGLALSVGAAVRAELGQKLDLKHWLDLVALGTIADVAPLDGDNRALVRAGLKELARGQRPGIRALLRRAKMRLDATVTGEDVAFRIAPRINAPGRLGEPDIALRMLLAKDEREAEFLADQLEAITERRRELDRSILKEAEAMLQAPELADLPAIVLGRDDWNPGVVGIVAGRLASSRGKPTVIIGFDGELGTGSVRGPRGARLYDALARSADTLEGFGGHQAAAGVRVRKSRLDAFRDAFCAACVELGSEAAAPETELRADARLEPADSPEKVLSELERFEPCGELNPAPRLAIVGAKADGVRELRGGHLRFELSQGRVSIPCIAFGMAEHAGAVTEGRAIVGSLRRNWFQGAGSPEFFVRAIEGV